MTPKRPQMKGSNEVKALKDKGQPTKPKKKWADMTPAERAATMRAIRPPGVRE